jgi:Leucine-rich repeat (LRR) protein
LRLPTSFAGLSSLVSLDLSDCNLLDGAIPDDLSCLSSLQSLNLSGNKFTSLPNSICQLSKLIELSLVNCSRLQALPKLPLSILYVWAQNCTSLETYSNQIYMWTSSENVAIVNCSRLAENEDQKFDKIFASNAQSHLLFQNLEVTLFLNTHINLSW